MSKQVSILLNDTADDVRMILGQRGVTQDTAINAALMAFGRITANDQQYWINKAGDFIPIDAEVPLDIGATGCTGAEATEGTQTATHRRHAQKGRRRGLKEKLEISPALDVDDVFKELT